MTKDIKRNIIEHMIHGWLLRMCHASSRHLLPLWRHNTSGNKTQLCFCRIQTSWRFWCFFLGGGVHLSHYRPPVCLETLPFLHVSVPLFILFCPIYVRICVCVYICVVCFSLSVYRCNAGMYLCVCVCVCVCVCCNIRQRDSQSYMHTHNTNKCLHVQTPQWRLGRRFTTPSLAIGCSWSNIRLARHPAFRAETVIAELGISVCERERVCVCLHAHSLNFWTSTLTWRAYK